MRGGLFPVKASGARLSQLQHFLWQVVCFDLLVMPTLTPYHAFGMRCTGSGITGYEKGRQSCRLFPFVEKRTSGVCLASSVEQKPV